MSSPFFSVILPTRNRPKMLKLSLQSLKYQTFKNFEIIVSDASDPKEREENQKVIQKLKLSNLRYFFHEEPPNMNDNWEFAVAQARGEYQSVLISKFLFYRNALETICKVLTNTPVDIINHSYDLMYYLPKHFFKYRFQYFPNIVEPADPVSYHPEEKIVKKFALDVPILQESRIDFVAGKLSYGFVKKGVIQKVKEKWGRLIFPISCDYTSTVLILNEAKSALFYPRSLQVNIINFSGSNGLQTQSVPGAIIRFLKTLDPTLSIVKDLPIPGLYFSLHNLCSYDYNQLNRLQPSPYTLNHVNLLQRCVEDFKHYPFASEKEMKEQADILHTFAKKEGVALPELENIPRTPSFFKPLPLEVAGFIKNMYGTNLKRFLNPKQSKLVSFAKFIKQF